MVVISWFINQHSHHWGAHPVCLLGLSGSSYGPSGSSQWTNFWSLKLCIHINGNFRNRLIGGTYHICKGISSQNMAWKMVQYLHFRILEFPLIHIVDCRCINRWGGWLLQKTLVCPTCRRSPKTSWLRTVERMLFSSKTSNNSAQAPQKRNVHNFGISWYSQFSTARMENHPGDTTGGDFSGVHEDLHPKHGDKPDAMELVILFWIFLNATFIFWLLLTLW